MDFTTLKMSEKKEFKLMYLLSEEKSRKRLYKNKKFKVFMRKSLEIKITKNILKNMDLSFEYMYKPIYGEKVPKIYDELKIHRYLMSVKDFRKNEKKRIYSLKRKIRCILLIILIISNVLFAVFIPGGAFIGCIGMTIEVGITEIVLKSSGLKDRIVDKLIDKDIKEIVEPLI